MNFCAKCGRERSGDARYCGGCGTEFAAASAAAVTPPTDDSAARSAAVTTAEAQADSATAEPAQDQPAEPTGWEPTPATAAGRRPQTPPG